MAARRVQRSGIHGLWERMDEKYLKPVFGGQPRNGRPVMETEMKNQASKQSSKSPKAAFPRSPNSRREHNGAPLSMAEVADSHEASEQV